jgi:hypothetical protein
MRHVVRRLHATQYTAPPLTRIMSHTSMPHTARHFPCKTVQDMSVRMSTTRNHSPTIPKLCVVFVEAFAERFPSALGLRFASGRPISMTGILVLCTVAIQGPSVLFYMPNRTNSILMVSVMSPQGGGGGRITSLATFWRPQITGSEDPTYGCR